MPKEAFFSHQEGQVVKVGQPRAVHPIGSEAGGTVRPGIPAGTAAAHGACRRLARWLRHCCIPRRCLALQKLPQLRVQAFGCHFRHLLAVHALLPGWHAHKDLEVGVPCGGCVGVCVEGRDGDKAGKDQGRGGVSTKEVRGDRQEVADGWWGLSRTRATASNAQQAVCCDG